MLSSCCFHCSFTQPSSSPQSTSRRSFLSTHECFLIDHCPFFHTNNNKKNYYMLPGLLFSFFFSFSSSSRLFDVWSAGMKRTTNTRKKEKIFFSHIYKTIARLHDYRSLIFVCKKRGSCNRLSLQFHIIEQFFLGVRKIVRWEKKMEREKKRNSFR